MVHRVPPVLLIDPLEQREVDHKCEDQLVRVHQLQPLAQFVAQLAESQVGGLGRARHNQQEVADFGANTFSHLPDLVQCQEPGDGGLDSLLCQPAQGTRLSGESHRDQSLDAPGLDEIRQLVKLPPGVRSAAWGPESLDDAPVLEDGLEHAEIRLRRDVRQIGEL